MSYFDENGRRIPTHEMRVYSYESRNYYRLNEPALDLKLILERSKKQNLVGINYSAKEFGSTVELLKEKINSNAIYKNLLKGVCIPFVFKRQQMNFDLGSELVDNLLPKLKATFLELFPDSEFKAILQSESKLHGNIAIHPDSKYFDFIEAVKQKETVGLYFPQALQGFDVYSQRAQMKALPDLDEAKLCLSGGVDICSALIGTPDLLFNEDFYTPIPVMSSYVHEDERMVLLLKSYGPHLEFWCMSQMLTKKITQVSEQWTGGLTFYC